MKKRPREPKPLHPTLASATGPALIKYLASCNSTVRSQSLRLVQSWLALETQQLDESDVKKLWKGLFYCLWHADKAQNQVALINRLTSLFLSLQPELSLEFFRGFLVTLRREWPGIDRLRLDKFYLLIRRSLRVLFELLRSKEWDLDMLGQYFGVLEKDGFLAEDKLRGNGVNYQVVSVFLEELKAVGFPVRKEVVDAILRPFFEVTLKGPDKILLMKVKGCLFDELVKMGKELLAQKRMGVNCEGKDGDMLLGVVALKMELSKKFYEIGSSVDCIQGNRKLALGLHEEFQKLEKELELSGIEIDVHGAFAPGAGDADEVPQLIPIELNDIQGNGEIGTEDGAEDEQSGERLFKKNKKAKKEMNGEDKKAKKEMNGEDKKRKKKKKKEKDDFDISKIESMIENCEWLGVSADEGDNLKSNAATAALPLDESFISNLQKQFEKVAAEMDSKCEEDLDSSETLLTSMKRSKRKRTKASDGLETSNPKTSKTDNVSVNESSEKSVGKSAKKVRFAMKNNLVWKPQNPLPPENLRLPPSVTPRGSALKKGVPPGPIIEMPPAHKKGKNKKKMAQKRVKRVTVKLQKQMQMQSG